MARFESKIILPENLTDEWIRQLPKPVVFTNGVFDILHRGHVTYLDAAAGLGQTLIVAVNSDESVRMLGKGSDRPINTCFDRMAVIASLACVQWVTYFTEQTPENLIAKICPQTIVKGGDYDMELLPETQLVRSWGGEAVAIPIEFKRSTTTLVQKIREST